MTARCDRQLGKPAERLLNRPGRTTETQPAALRLLTSLSTYSLSDFMTLDAATRRNLATLKADGGELDWPFDAAAAAAFLAG